MTALPSATGHSSAAARVAPALAEAARRTGVPFDALFNTARLESGFDPDARARTSSATGLFQFIDSTWLNTLARHGARHGLAPASREDALRLRRDPYAASLMAAHYMADNAAVLTERTGRQPGQVELYLAHFLGAGGAAGFLDRMAEAPDMPAADALPAAARANRGVFFTGGRARSLAEVYDLFARKLGAGGTPDAAMAAASAQAPAALLPSSKGTEQAAPVLPEPNPAQALHSARLAYLLLADLGA
jgi:hypothetical protein